MFTGEKINITENRAVLHVALRAPKTEKIFCGWRGCRAGVHEVLDKMAGFARAHSQWRIEGTYRQAHQELCQYRIGGSDLGPVMAYEALKHYSQRDLIFRFVSNVDWNGFRRGSAGSGRRGDVVSRCLEDVYDAGDDDERASARDWSLAKAEG